ncbi:MAG: hypothetical protein H6595_01195 [Flavobacteriales bacterium]|nr:hypothetical protein [Flavobacteriales bacterium]MCB9166074.1 hypothetical protein [Flavobacteriales bacterium]
MPPTKTTAPTAASAEAQITTILSKFAAKDQQLIRAVRKALQKRFPTANELVYDYARNFVIGYSPTQAGGQGIAALSADAGGVRLYLTNGASLPDPHKLLQGKAQARYLPLGSAAVLLRPEVEALFVAAEKSAKVPLAASGRGEVIIKPGAAEKKPRKKAPQR